MTEPAWSGLFSGAPFEFRFGARPGDPEGFFRHRPNMTVVSSYGARSLLNIRNGMCFRCPTLMMP